MHTPQDHPDFIGWHCQASSRRGVEREDFIGYHYDRYDTWGRILQALSPVLKNRLLQDAKEYAIYYSKGDFFGPYTVGIGMDEAALAVNGLRNLTEGLVDAMSARASTLVQMWSHMLKSWFVEVGLRWIWVDQTSPSWSGSRAACYGIFLAPEAIVVRIWDSAVDHTEHSYVYVYDSNIATPQVIPVAWDSDYYIWGNPPNTNLRTED